MSNDSAVTFLSGTLITDTYAPANGSSDSIPPLSRNVNGTISSALEIKSTSGGVLIPRMTTAQINALNSDNGMMVYDTTVSTFKFNQNGAWVTYLSGGGAGYSPGNPTYLQDTTAALTYNLSMGTPPVNFAGSQENSAFGCQAMNANNGGNYNSAFGYQSLYSSVDSSRNSAFGTNSLLRNVSGNDNTSVGFNSCGGAADPGDWSCSENTAVGSYALSKIQGGNYNCAFGYQALQNIVDSFENCAFGFNAGISLSDTSGGNCLFGSNSGKDAENIIGCSFFGNQIGVDLSNLTGCTLIGINSRCASGLLNATAIGAGSHVDISNALVLGNNDNVGIGTSSPANILHVVGTTQLQGLASGSNAGTGVYRTQYAVQGATNIQFPLNTSFNSQIIVTVTISAANPSSSGQWGYARSTAAAFYNGTTSLTGTAPTITFTTVGGLGAIANWLVLGNNLVLNVGNVTLYYVVTAEYFSGRSAP